MGDGVKFEFFTGLLKSVDTEAEDGEKRLLTTASSTIRDLSGDVMTLKALQRMAETAQDNMTIFLNHKYQVPEDVLGSVEKATIKQHGTDIFDLDLLIRVDKSNDRATKTYNQINDGAKLGCSVGALIPAGGAKRTDDGLLIDEVQLLEASIVGIPANPRSYAQYAMKAYGMAEKVLEDPDAAEPPFPGAVWDTKAQVWVTIDTDPAKPEEETKVKPKGDAKKKSEVEPEVTKDGPPAIDDDEESVVAGSDESTTETDETAGPSETEDSADGEEAAADTQPADTDVPATQEAQKSVPESEGEDETASELIGRSIEAIQLALQNTTIELVDARKSLADETVKRAAAEQELSEAKKGLKLAQQIVERIAALPIGRRAGFAPEVTGFRTKFAELYDSEFLKLLEK